MFYQGLLDTSFILHHAACFLGLVYPVVTKKLAIESLCGMVLGEFTNPCLCLREILKYRKQDKTN